jgi:hypothetical protein
MTPRGFARSALAGALALAGIAAAPPVASAQSQEADQPVTVPYTGGPVDQRPLPPPAPLSYTPPQNGAANYNPQSYSPPPPPPAPQTNNNSDDQRYAARDRTERQDYAPQPNYGSQDDSRYTRDARAEYAPPPPPQEHCQTVEQLTVFPDDTVQRTNARACRDGRGRWRLDD